MLRNRLYYGIKPFVPAGLRLGVRRWIAARRRGKVSSIWPIMPGSERVPEGWPGWPEGKQFSLVLSHDVEGPRGLEKSRQLMELEKELGFRSCFNFVPRGSYPVSRSFLEEFIRNGFEVGVHDLFHDGKLFLSQKEFLRRAPEINGFLRDWGAAGFRSGFMLHNLEWLHDLEIAYDSSTFDTDPFEPQPQGRETIFPFWVASEAPSGTRHGYVELPYTLPQDSTLFLLLRERSPEIWTRKLDWIARHGGMALVNVHPDYIQFEGEAASNRTYPVDLYIRFLQHVKANHGASIWHQLPREVARFASQKRLPPRRKPLRVAMVTYSHYLTDARVTRYAEALAERGDHVDVVALKGGPEEPREEKVGQVNVARLQDRFKKDEKSPLGFLLPVLRFLACSSWWCARRHHRQPYDLLHIHSVPDFMVFAGLYPRLRGAKVILDIHDILPEFYGSKFGVTEHSVPVLMARCIERGSSLVAHHVIIANHLWLEKYAARNRREGRCSVFINNVDRRIFTPRARTRNDGKRIIIFPGGLQWHQGLDIALQAFVHVRAALPDAEFHIYGEGNMKGKLVALANELGLGDGVRFFKPMPVREVARKMAEADLGVVPKRADSFGNEAYSTKIMEFMSLGVPVVVSNTKIDRFYFDDSVVRFFQSGDPAALAAAILDVLGDRSSRELRITHALDYAARHSWEVRKPVYLDLVDSLVQGRCGKPEGAVRASMPANPPRTPVPSSCAALADEAVVKN